MGVTRQLAERVNLAAMTPHGEFASTRYCLAQPGHEYLVYLPQGGEVTVDVTAVSGEIEIEWVNPNTGEISPGKSASGGAPRAFNAPFTGHAVLYLRKPTGLPKP
jgi:hypothetical protein